MRLIALEEHYSSKKVEKECEKYAVKRENGKAADETLKKFYASFQQTTGRVLEDIEEMRLPFMDAHGISMQVLSYNTSIPQTLPADAAVGIYQMANDIMAEQIAGHPDRFCGFAALPMADPKRAAGELERCVRGLGFRGAMLNGNFNGHFYDEKQFFPIFEKAAELDVPVYFHPSFVPPFISDYYYKSENWSPVVTGEFASAGFGWHMDIGIHVVRMILSGIFDKLPGLKLFSGHWGEFVPCFLERMDAILTQDKTGLNKKISEYYKEHIFLTPSGILSEMQLEYCVKLMGASHILYAVDYPYVKPENAGDFLMNSNLDTEEKEMISHRNAERLMKLG